MIKTIISGLLFLGCLEFSFAQEYDLSVTQTTQTIDDISYKGYETNFDAAPDELQKLWWRYAKKFSVVTNMKSHHQVKIPTADKSLLPITLVETTKAYDSGSKIFLAVYDQTNNNFKQQVKNILLEFKVHYYVDQLEDKISLKEQELSTVTSHYQAIILSESKAEKKGVPVIESTTLKDELIEQMSTLSIELEGLKRELVEVR